MTTDPYRKGFIYTFALFIICFAILGISYHFLNPYAEKGIRISTQAVLNKSDTGWLQLADRVRIKSAGVSYITVFRTEETEISRSKLVFVVPITGNAGPYTGVFLCDPAEKTHFCGLAGIQENNSAEYYGITNTIIQFWIHKIDVLAQQYGDEK